MQLSSEHHIQQQMVPRRPLHPAKPFRKLWTEPKSWAEPSLWFRSSFQKHAYQVFYDFVTNRRRNIKKQRNDWVTDRLPSRINGRCGHIRHNWKVTVHNLWRQTCLCSPPEPDPSAADWTACTHRSLSQRGLVSRMNPCTPYGSIHVL